MLIKIKSDDGVLRFSSGGAHSIGNFRRLSKDYEITTSSAKAFIELAKIMMKFCQKVYWFLFNQNYKVSSF
ncbi:hypothetical protein [Candidatus Cyrtobacter comes]|uniref:hypothetical protein n=1 Tax=Candidatus Cyrtobacter comes TaxID=675776 RepID=UPI002ACD6942|nr:hypothetical protein [Candidatus Cyrtobacter comes]